MAAFRKWFEKEKERDKNETKKEEKDIKDYLRSIDLGDYEDIRVPIGLEDYEHELGQDEDIDFGLEYLKEEHNDWNNNGIDDDLERGPWR